MVSFNFMPGAQQQASTSSQDGAASPSPNDRPLDVVFLQDTTGSQGPYIQSARKAIRDICDKISTSGELSKDLIRFGLIAFRDHPPQDMTYVTKEFGFTSDIDVIQKNLASLVASGGGDGPEAQTAALAAALNMDWAENAVKMVILITDAPPHGIGESRDGFTESPDQNDPLELARQMAEKGITLFVIACEPGLSKYVNAVDFYTALTQITSGKMFPLLMADKLGDYIVGTAIETIETEKLIGEFEQVILDDVYTNAKPIADVAQNLQAFMKERGVKINTLEVENVYNETATTRQNVAYWGAAENLSKARKNIVPSNAPRMQAAYSGGNRNKAGHGAFGAAPSFSLQPQPIGLAQANRVVMQSVARSSKVTATGMLSKVNGEFIPFSPPPPPV
ncbi:hypothetical protein M413DRAFT_443633 [Hebeloma cylindrosporum]|uniref:VWFA domain-containing protein n=1 Tax=Hebeloma cylindrosporum TaxID=76867 RepID=A0A0C2YRS9_HEBCY|nr:hypothetical protein M413DRAFT_443633 [Hebeloma cylindrosporum h7]